jgi:uncharacterized membrane protein YjgN (DUF898 family)
VLILICAFAAPWFFRNSHAGLQAALIGMLAGSVFASFTLITWMYLWIVIALMMASGLTAAAAKPLAPIWKLPAFAWEHSLSL